MVAMTEHLPHLEDDGLITPEVGSWAEDKYRLIGIYAKMFSTATKGKWGSRVYIDLFAGAGRSRIEGSSIIVPASPLLALDIPDKFDKYIFCEYENEKASALKARVLKDFTDVNVSYVVGDANLSVENILSHIPQHSSDYKVLSCCFADPYRLNNLKFETIKRLASKYIDFLVLIPSYMDAHRNLSDYIADANTAIESFTGAREWRNEWSDAHLSGKEFGDFVADLFGREMRKLGYIYPDISDMKLVRSTEKNLRLYHLAFFSRSKLGAKFWQQAKKYGKDQMDLFA